MGQLARVGQTSREHYALAKDEVHGRVVGVMNDWDLPVPQMTKVMKEDEIVLSGSVGLDIAIPGYVTPKYLDVCVPLGRLSKFQKWLSDNTYYRE
jgi:hypothetical protein